MIIAFVITMLIAILLCLLEFIVLLFDWGIRKGQQIRKKRTGKGENNEEDIDLDSFDLTDRVYDSNDRAGSGKRSEVERDNRTDRPEDCGL